MKYKLIIERSAQKALAKIAQPYQDRIIKAIESLASEPRPPGVRKLTVRKGWRICIGAYRGLYRGEGDQGQGPRDKPGALRCRRGEGGAQPVARARISRNNGGNNEVTMALDRISANWYDLDRAGSAGFQPAHMAGDRLRP